MRNWREGFEDSGREGIAEELGVEGIEGEALGLCAGFFDMAFLGLTEASAAAAAAESSLNFLTASFACLANLACRLAHSSGNSSRLMLVGSASWPGANGGLGHGGLSVNFFMYLGVTYLYSLHSLAHLLSILCMRTLR